MEKFQFSFIHQDDVEANSDVADSSDLRLGSSKPIVEIESHSACSPLPWESLDFKTIMNFKVLIKLLR